jgi:3-methyladenine DNA glycosylase/8-oxoguanine DNA glycosylase
VAGADSPTWPGGGASARFALGVDDDLPVHDRFRSAHRAIGISRPHLRVIRRPDPFEALAWAICEQLIEAERAEAIERRIVARLAAPRATGLRDLPRRRRWPPPRPRCCSR